MYMYMYIITCIYTDTVCLNLTLWQDGEGAGRDASVREVQSSEFDQRRVEEKADPSVSGLHVGEVETLQRDTACGWVGGGEGRRKEGELMMWVYSACYG